MLDGFKDTVMINEMLRNEMWLLHLQHVWIDLLDSLRALDYPAEAGTERLGIKTTKRSSRTSEFSSPMGNIASKISLR